MKIQRTTAGDIIIVPTYGHTLTDNIEIHVKDLHRQQRPQLPRRTGGGKQLHTDSFNPNIEPCSINDIIYRWIADARLPVIAERRESSGNYLGAYYVDADHHPPTEPIRKSTMGRGALWITRYYDANHHNQRTNRAFALNQLAKALAWHHCYPSESRKLTAYNINRANETMRRFYDEQDSMLKSR